MSLLERTKQALGRRRDHASARKALRAAPANALSGTPEPWLLGRQERAKALIEGHYRFGGAKIDAPPGTPPFKIARDNAAFQREAQCFFWLEDLAASPDDQARDLAQQWFSAWVADFGRGKGLAWEPDLTAQRLLRQIVHAEWLSDAGLPGQLDHMLHAQATFLAARADRLQAGIIQVEALAARILAALHLTSRAEDFEPALRALGRLCDRLIDMEGALASRNPEELAHLFVVLALVAADCTDQDQLVSIAQLDAMTRAAPVLRALRHSDGSLARFHGGGRGPEGQLDRALASFGTRETRKLRPAMGYIRLSGGRTSVIADAALPAAGAASTLAHASTLAFELTSGRRPLIVSSGSGAGQGEAWRLAARATASHSTLGLRGLSSSRLAPPVRRQGVMVQELADGPSSVPAKIWQDEDGAHFVGSHDGYRLSHGLLHSRRLTLSIDGRTLSGEDVLSPATQGAEMPQGLLAEIRFHLHPDCEPFLALNGGAVSLTLLSGEHWIFRHDGQADLSLEPSAYLESGRDKPRASEQMVLSATTSGQTLSVRWTLAKAQDTPRAIRDLVREDARR